MQSHGIDCSETCHYGPSALARAFMQRVWPRLVADIRAELDAEVPRG
jgi:hypothetical protein